MRVSAKINQCYFQCYTCSYGISKSRVLTNALAVCSSLESSHTPTAGLTIHQHTLLISWAPLHRTLCKPNQLWHKFIMCHWLTQWHFNERVKNNE